MATKKGYSRPVQEPLIERSTTTGETKATHPAFAQIAASRVSGHAQLYGSDFTHQHYMTIRINGSELHRGLNRDWHFGKETMIEVAMTESQWATFVSSPNMGSGVPCTLQRKYFEDVPGLPEPKPRQDQFSDEMQDSMTKAVERMDSLIAGAKTKAQADEMRMVKMLLTSTFPFVTKQFSEHMEETVEKAKQEVHGYMTATLQRAGLAALSSDLPLQIGGPDAE